MDDAIKAWEDMGYTNLKLCEQNVCYMGEVDIEINSLLYQKIESIYGCQTENIMLVIFDGYGDDKYGNRKNINEQ